MPFQPFLRFCLGSYLALSGLGAGQSFQPFLRFYEVARKVAEAPNTIWDFVSTLLEILGDWRDALDSPHIHGRTVSTLLEILDGIALEGRRVTLWREEFQPFLRFWSPAIVTI